MQARIRDLEGALHQEDRNLAIAFRLTPALNNLLGLLMSLPVVTPAVIELRLEVVTNARVSMHRLRQCLEPFGVKVMSRRTLGYWLDAETKARIRAMLSPDGVVTPEATTQVAA